MLNDIAESKRVGDVEREADLVQKQMDWRRKKESPRKRTEIFSKNLQYIAKYGMLTMTAELGLIVFF